MAYKVIILYRLYMPSYFLGTFTEYPSLERISGELLTRSFSYSALRTYMHIPTKKLLSHNGST